MRGVGVGDTAHDQPGGDLLVAAWCSYFRYVVSTSAGGGFGSAGRWCCSSSGGMAGRSGCYAGTRSGCCRGMRSAMASCELDVVSRNRVSGALVPDETDLGD